PASLEAMSRWLVMLAYSICARCNGMYECTCALPVYSLRLILEKRICGAYFFALSHIARQAPMFRSIRTARQLRWHAAAQGVKRYRAVWTRTDGGGRVRLTRVPPGAGLGKGGEE